MRLLNPGMVKIRKNVNKFEILPIGNNPKATIVVILRMLISRKPTNCFIFTQTLNFIYDFRSARGTYRLLKPGGTLWRPYPAFQISRLHGRWGDYWRLQLCHAKDF